MEFDSNHKVKIETLNTAQATAFLDFLHDERKRHVKCAEEADFMWGMRPIIGWIYVSAAIRHDEAIKSIDALIKQVKEML